MMNISRPEARSLALHRQLLHPQYSLRGKEDTLRTIQKIGYVQIDTLSVVKRAHHHVLWSRVPGYRPEYLKALERERRIFEYWAHAAGYLPIDQYRFTLPRQEEVRAGEGMWHDRNPGLMQYALDRIKAEGPLMSRDFKKDDTRLYFGGKQEWSTTPISHTLFQLFMEGRLMVVERKGFQKVFDLTERVLPADTDTRTPTRDEYIRHLIDRDIQAHGLVKAAEIGYLIKNTSADINRLLNQMLEQEEIVEVSIERSASTYYTRAAYLEELPAINRERRIRILSPFDNLIIQRKRTEELFDFSYTLECYVPKKKRKIGYFSLPLLRGTEFVGQVDLKADRKAQILMVKNLVWEPGNEKKDHLREALEKSLREFADFNGCEDVAWER
jgi:uncharacterized protein YcaQ